MYAWQTLHLSCSIGQHMVGLSKHHSKNFMKVCMIFLYNPVSHLLKAMRDVASWIPSVLIPANIPHLLNLCLPTILKYAEVSKKYDQRKTTFFLCCEIWPNSPRKCLITAKNKKGIFTDRYTAGICEKFWYVVGIWLIWYTYGMWKSREWLKLKILVYKLVYVEIWYTSGMWTKKRRMKSYTDLFFLPWCDVVEKHIISLCIVIGFVIGVWWRAKLMTLLLWCVNSCHYQNF